MSKEFDALVNKLKQRSAREVKAAREPLPKQFSHDSGCSFGNKNDRPLTPAELRRMNWDDPSKRALYFALGLRTLMDVAKHEERFGQIIK